MQHISDNSGFWQHKPAPVYAQLWSGQNTTELGMRNSRVPSNDGNTRGCVIQQQLRLVPLHKIQGPDILSHCTRLLRNCEKSKEIREPNKLIRGNLSPWEHKEQGQGRGSQECFVHWNSWVEGKAAFPGNKPRQGCPEVSS